MEVRYEDLHSEATAATLSSDLDTDEEEFMTMQSLATQFRKTTIEDKESTQKTEEEGSHHYEVVLNDYQRTPAHASAGE